MSEILRDAFATLDRVADKVEQEPVPLFARQAEALRSENKRLQADLEEANRQTQHTGRMLAETVAECNGLRTEGKSWRRVAEIQRSVISAQNDLLLAHPRADRALTTLQKAAAALADLERSEADA